MSERSALLGFGRRPIKLEEFRASAREWTERFSRLKVEEACWASFAQVSLPKISSGMTISGMCANHRSMVALLTRFLLILCSLLKSRARLEAENLHSQRSNLWSLSVLELDVKSVRTRLRHEPRGQRVRHVSDEYVAPVLVGYRRGHFFRHIGRGLNTNPIELRSRNPDLHVWGGRVFLDSVCGTGTETDVQLPLYIDHPDPRPVLALTWADR
jgi:hypothetical protein